jgi:hypothetical protein
MAVVDRIRNDQRTEMSPEPFWLTSAELDKADLKANTVIIADLPAGTYCLHGLFIEHDGNVAGTSGFDLGVGDVPFNNAGYEGATVSNGAVVFNDILATPAMTPGFFTQDDKTLRVVLTLAEDDNNTMSAGVVRAHVLLSKIPTVTF